MKTVKEVRKGADIKGGSKYGPRTVTAVTARPLPPPDWVVLGGRPSRRRRGNPARLVSAEEPSRRPRDKESLYLSTVEGARR